ncbi:MAG TPA: hypothetical protein VD948_02615, partial [Rhodothermales bacterium]|nr:hypothetical protein [Rhodothermales bacterium]
MRVYSEQEVSQILERAVEQQARAHPASPEAGLTLEELERIGYEVGIEARYLRSAAAEVDASGGATTRRSRSATHLFVERWVPATLTDEAWEDMVAELETRVGKGKHTSGKARRHEQREGRNREWVHSDSIGYET